MSTAGSSACGAETARRQDGLQPDALHVRPSLLASTRRPSSELRGSFCESSYNLGRPPFHAPAAVLACCCLAGVAGATGGKSARGCRRRMELVQGQQHWRAQHCLSLRSCITTLSCRTLDLSMPRAIETSKLARLLQARRRRRTGHRSVCESRLFLKRTALHLAWLLVVDVPRLPRLPRLPHLPRLRVPGVSPWTARARMSTRCCCWLAVGTETKRPNLPVLVGSIFDWRALPVVAASRDSRPSSLTHPPLLHAPATATAVCRHIHVTILPYITIIILLLDRPRRACDPPQYTVEYHL